MNAHTHNHFQSLSLSILCSVSPIPARVRRSHWYVQSNEHTAREIYMEKNQLWSVFPLHEEYCMFLSSFFFSTNRFRCVLHVMLVRAALCHSFANWSRQERATRAKIICLCDVHRCNNNKNFGFLFRSRCSRLQPVWETLNKRKFTFKALKSPKCDWCDTDRAMQTQVNVCALRCVESVFSVCVCERE